VFYVLSVYKPPRLNLLNKVYARIPYDLITDSYFRSIDFVEVLGLRGMLRFCFSYFACLCSWCKTAGGLQIPSNLPLAMGTQEVLSGQISFSFL